MNRQLPSLNEIAGNLAKAISAAALYAPEHPQVEAGLPGIVDPLKRILAEAPDLTLVFIKDEVFFQGKPLEKTPHLQRVAQTFSRHRIGHIRFLPGTDIADLRQLIHRLTGAPGSWNEPGSRIHIGDVDLAGDAKGENDPVAESFEQLTQIHIEELQAIFSSIGEQEKIDVRQLVSLLSCFVAAFRREVNPLRALIPLRMTDEYTFTHSINVGILNLAQGMSLGIQGQLLHDIGIAGILHDAGKIFIDREIIQKPGKLAEEEMAMVRSHPFRGAQYLLSQEGVPAVAVFAAFEHHMYYDLSGYPPVPPGWSLNLCSQMTMVSDTFDALRTRRVYRGAWDFEKVSQHMLRLAGSQLNPDLTVNFLGLLAQLGEGVPPEPELEKPPARENYCE